MKRFKFLSLAALILILSACSTPNDKLVGNWEYDSYEIDKSGFGSFAYLLPEGWMQEIDKYIDMASGFSKGIYEFREDGTYKTSYSGTLEGFTEKDGNFSMSPDFKVLTLRNGTSETTMKIKEITNNYFVHQWEFKDYSIPVTINLKYKKVKSE